MDFNVDMSALMLNGIVLVGVLYAIAVEVSSLVHVLGRFRDTMMVVRVKRVSRWWYRCFALVAAVLAMTLVVTNNSVIFAIALSALAVGFFFYSLLAGICLIGETGMGQAIPGRGMEIAWTEIAGYNWKDSDLRVSLNHGVRKDIRFRFRDSDQLPDIKERMTRYLERVTVN